MNYSKQVGGVRFAVDIIFIYVPLKCLVLVNKTLSAAISSVKVSFCTGSLTYSICSLPVSFFSDTNISHADKFCKKKSESPNSTAGIACILSATINQDVVDPTSSSCAAVVETHTAAAAVQELPQDKISLRLADGTRTRCTPTEDHDLNQANTKMSSHLSSNDDPNEGILSQLFNSALLFTLSDFVYFSRCRR